MHRLEIKLSRLIFSFSFPGIYRMLFLLSKRDKYQKTQTFRSDSQYRRDKEKDCERKRVRVIYMDRRGRM